MKIIKISFSVLVVALLVVSYFLYRELAAAPATRLSTAQPPHAVLGSVLGPIKAASAASFPTGQWNLYGYHYGGRYCGKATTGTAYTYVLPSCGTKIKILARRASTPTPYPTPTNVPVSYPTATPVPVTGTCTDDASCVTYLLGLLNQERTSHGIPPLTIDWTQSNGTSSCPGAKGHSQHMADTNTLAHDQFPSDICATSYYAIGENIGYAYGSEQSAIDQINQMMLQEPYSTGCSGNHHCNIDSSSYSRVGIGFAYNGTYWLTEDFIG